jgi:uncharacterized membrane protein (Fun14 family)
MIEMAGMVGMVGIVRVAGMVAGYQIRKNLKS